MRMLSAVFALLCGFGIALAGPNSGGVLLVHYDSQTAVPSEPSFVERTLAACDSAAVLAPSDSTILWCVYAAFPPGASPRLRVVTFGCVFDQDRVGILWYAKRPGAQEIRYEQGNQWPYPGSGIALGFAETLTPAVDEVCCFAGYGLSETSFELVPHPDPVIGGTFADDNVPSQLDSIAGYGSLGLA
jgi:hypothetical protein